MNTQEKPIEAGMRNGPWMLAMRWQDLLFAHWRVDPDRLRPFIPAGLELDLRDGAAWLGVVPFRMSGVRPRPCPPVPGVSAFPELNLRTYVRCGPWSGVWFFSLDAASRLAVRLARWSFHLPYFDAAMSCQVLGSGAVRYRSRRVHRGVVPAEFECDYEPEGQVFRSVPGTLEHWLTERYCLFSADARGRVYRGDIDHEPWPLQRARARFQTCRMTGLVRIPLEGEPENLLFARSVDVRAWLLREAWRPPNPHRPSTSSRRWPPS